jgi:hypothetical protein
MVKVNVWTEKRMTDTVDDSFTPNRVIIVKTVMINTVKPRISEREREREGERGVVNPIKPSQWNERLTNFRPK